MRNGTAGVKTPLVAAFLLAVNVVAAAVSIDEGMPAEFGKGFLGPLALDGDPNNVLTEFLTWRGTALAAPLPLLVIVAVLALRAARGSLLATRGLGGIGALALVGYLGEPVTRDALAGDVGAAKTAIVLLGLGLSAALALTGLTERRDVAVPAEVTRA